MADAGRGEGRGQVAIDPIAQADQDPGRQAGFRFREDPGECVARAAPQVLEATPEIARCRPDPERPCRQRAGRADPGEIVTVGRRRVAAGSGRRP